MIWLKFGKFRKLYSNLNFGGKPIPNLETTTDCRPIDFSNYLSNQSIRFFDSNITYKQIFRELINTLQLPFPELAFQAVLERENLSSTVTKMGIALPHALVKWEKTISAALGICPQGVEVPCLADSTRVVRLFLLYIGPSRNGQQIGQFLNSMQSVIKTDDFENSLLQLKTAEEVLSQIRKIEWSMSERAQLVS